MLLMMKRRPEPSNSPVRALESKLNPPPSSSSYFSLWRDRQAGRADTGARETQEMTSGQRKLGRRTLSALTEVLNARFSNSEIRDLLFKHGLADRYEGANKADRLAAVFHPLVNPQRYSSLWTPDGLPYEDYEGEVRSAWDVIDEVALDIYQTLEASPHWEQGERLLGTLRGSLRVDGLDLLDGRVVPFLSPSVDTATEQGSLESRLDALGFKVARNHLDQAVDNAARRNWESANSQIRSFLEAVCDAVADQLHTGSSEAPTRGAARQYLADEGFIDEYEDKLLRAFFKVLHGGGGHSGTSKEADCHRRRLMAFSLANYYLDRLEEWPDGA